MSEKKLFNIKIISLCILCFAPLLILCNLPKEYMSKSAGEWALLCIGLWGLFFGWALKQFTEVPYEKLKRDYSLMPMPSWEADAVIIRIGYTAGFIAYELNRPILALYLLWLLFK